MGIDNHVDKMVLGSNSLPVNDFERSLDVSGWDVSAESVECTTISGAIAYDHPISGKVYIMVYHHAIRCPILENHLMCSMQSRMEGVSINELPKFLAEDLD